MSDEKPQKISKEEALQFENFGLRIEALESQVLLTKAQHGEFMREMREKYALAEQDKIDMRTLAIVRAPKPEPVKDEPKPAPAA